MEQDTTVAKMVHAILWQLTNDQLIWVKQVCDGILNKRIEDNGKPSLQR